MIRGQLAILLGCLCLALAFTLPPTPEDEIIVQDAELVAVLPNTYSPDVADLIASVPPRFVIQYGEFVRHIPLLPLHGSLQNLLEQMEARMVIQHAEANEQYALVFPAALPQDGLPTHLHYSVIYLPMVRK